MDTLASMLHIVVTVLQGRIEQKTKPQWPEIL